MLDLTDNVSANAYDKLLKLDISDAEKLVDEGKVKRVNCKEFFEKRKNAIEAKLFSLELLSYISSSVEEHAILNKGEPNQVEYNRAQLEDSYTGLFSSCFPHCSP